PRPPDRAADREVGLARRGADLLEGGRPVEEGHQAELLLGQARGLEDGRGFGGRRVALLEGAGPRLDPAPALHAADPLHEYVLGGHAQQDDLARGELALDELVRAVLPEEEAVD